MIILILGSVTTIFTSKCYIIIDESLAAHHKKETVNSSQGNYSTVFGDLIIDRVIAIIYDSFYAMILLLIFIVGTYQ